MRAILPKAYSAITLTYADQSFSEMCKIGQIENHWFDYKPIGDHE